ncbi:MAG: diguanylate cyclase [Xanthomonadales bacterium]|nr:diguanylate cyclase [Xanthomonadales bacterium]
MNKTPSIPKDKLLDLLLDAVCVVDVDGRFLWVSAASERVFGFRPEEMIGRTAFEMMHPDDRAATRALVETINSGVAMSGHENRYLHKDGSIAHIMWSARWLEDEQVRIGVARNITDRKRAEAKQSALYAISEAAHESDDLMALFERVHAIINDLLPARNFFVVLYDANKDELSFPYYVDQVGQTPPSQPLSSGSLSAEVVRSGQPLLLTPDNADELLVQKGLGASEYSLDWLGVPMIADNQTVGALVVQSYDGNARYSEQDKELLQFVSSQVAAAIERKRADARLRHIAEHDQLTQLPNRALFMDRLLTSLARARRNSLQLAVLYLDLDQFKQINDTHGHTTGDQLLREVAGRLLTCVRESDTVGRLGGDEFAVVLDDIGCAEDATVVAEKILAALSEPCALPGRTLQITPSVGIAIYPEDGQDEEQLVRHADDAMYAAKRGGGRRYNTGSSPSSG